MLEKIVSGGQTGVDRAALDAAMALGIEVGGWCPKGRRALDGVIPGAYPLKETTSKAYRTRTLWNVRDSDATLVLFRDEPTGGTALTIEYCKKLGKPYRVYRLPDAGHAVPNGTDSELTGLLNWLNSGTIHVLNVAGPREEESRPVYDLAYSFLKKLFRITQQE